MKIKVAYVDREWGQCEDKKVVGDMGYTFCDRPDTMSTDVDELKDNINNWINGSDCVEEGDTFDEEYKQFAIYLVYVTTTKAESKEDILWTDVDLDNPKLTDVYVCASEEIAGWVKEQYKEKNVTFHFRVEE